MKIATLLESWLGVPVEGGSVDTAHFLNAGFSIPVGTSGLPVFLEERPLPILKETLFPKSRSAWVQVLENNTPALVLGVDPSIPGNNRILLSVMLERQFLESELTLWLRGWREGRAAFSKIGDSFILTAPLICFKD